MDLSSPLTALKGVGEKRKKVYEKLGITNIGELLEHYPRGYLDLTGSLSIKDASDEHPCAIRATVTQKSPTRPIRKGSRNSAGSIKVLAVSFSLSSRTFIFFMPVSPRSARQRGTRRASSD